MMRNTIRRAALVAASTGLVAAGAAAVTATPAQAAAPVCSVHVVSLYAYDYFRATDWLTLIAGVTWDHIERP